MANYSAIKAAVNAYIKANGKKEITGRILNSVLNATIDSLGRFFQFAGGAMPTDDPGTPDQNVCYLATEPGLYTNFGNIRIENEEVALLFWNGEWVKESIALGIQEVNASVDNQVGTPSVDVSYSGGQLVLTFHNLKGEQGIQGIQGIQGEQGLQGVQGVKGDTGAAAGFGTIGADIAGGVGTPGVSVETSGDNTAKNLMFHFTNLKGETGVTSVVATIDDTSGTPSCQVSLVNGVLTLAFSGLKGLKGDTGVSADYPIAIYNGLDSDATDQALAAAQGKVLDGKIGQLHQEVSEGEPRTLVQDTDYTLISGTIKTNGTIENTAYHSSPIFLKKGEIITYTPQYKPTRLAIALTDSTGSWYVSVVPNTGNIPFVYTAVDDCYVAFNVNASSSNNGVTILGLPLTSRMSNVETISESLQNTVGPNVRNITLSDYTQNSGRITVDGLVTTGNFWYSSPIAVKRGDIVHLETAYQGNGMAIGLTDANGGFYRVLAIHSSVKNYTVTVSRDGYIAICYIANYLPTAFTITSSLASGSLGAAADYSDANITEAIDGDSVEISTIQSNSHKSRNTADIRGALFERAKMLDEVSDMTEDDVLVQGTCGYSESNGTITDGTIIWKIYKGGILYISGYGKFYDFIKGSNAARDIASVNSVVSTLGQDYWFYGFVVQNVNGIVPPFTAEQQSYAGHVMNYANKRYVPFGENTNPLNGLPYGYAAPWYIYRTEVDWDYQPKSAYDTNNPHGIRYNRVCIDEDTTHGGITYIGNWAFYRCSAKSLVLPDSATKIGCWGIRYSPTVDTVVMGDSITEIEDHGCSRMEALRSIHISTALTSFGYAGMEMDAVIEYIDLPNSVTTIGPSIFNGLDCLTMLKLRSVTGLPYGMTVNSPLTEIEIPEGVTTIDDNALFGASLTKVVIPSTVTAINGNAFRRNFNLKTVVLKSNSITSGMVETTGNLLEIYKQGYLFAYNDWLIIPSANSISPWFYKFFDKVKDDGTYVYFKRAYEKSAS